MADLPQREGRTFWREFAKVINTLNIRARGSTSLSKTGYILVMLPCGDTTSFLEGPCSIQLSYGREGANPSKALTESHLTTVQRHVVTDVPRVSESV